MPLVHEEETVLVRIQPLCYEGVAYDRKRIIGCRNLQLVVCLDVPDDFGLPFHLTMDSEKFFVTCRLVLDQSPIRHCEDGVTWLFDGQCCCTTASDALVEHVASWNLRHPGVFVLVPVGEVGCSRWSLPDNVYHNLLIISLLKNLYFFLEEKISYYNSIYKSTKNGVEQLTPPYGSKLWNTGFF